MSNREIKLKIDEALPTDDDTERGTSNREMKRKIDSAGFPTDDDSKGVRVPYRLRERKGYDIYVKRIRASGCCWTGKPPTMVDSYDVAIGAKFLKKTRRITPDDSVATLIWSGNDEILIILKGKDSVCAVSHDKVKDSTLQADIYGSAGPFFYGEELEKLGYALYSSEADRKMPFASVILSLDTTKKDCGDSPRIHYLEDSRHEDFGARYNEKTAIAFLENKVKEVPVIGHEETVQTAIKAFKILMREDFKGDEMKVYVVARDISIDRALSAEEIKGHLEVIRD